MDKFQEWWSKGDGLKAAELLEQGSPTAIKMAWDAALEVAALYVREGDDYYGPYDAAKLRAMKTESPR